MKKCKMELKPLKMNWGRLRSSGNENVFKGSQLVSSLLERNPQHFRSRAAALKYSRQLFHDGVIRGVFGADTFEDSVQLYTWTEKYDAEMMSYSSPPTRHAYQVSGHDVKLTRRELQQSDQNVLDDVKHKFSSQHVKQRKDYPKAERRVKDRTEPRSSKNRTESRSNKQITSYQTSWNLQGASGASSDSSVEAAHHFTHKTKEKSNIKPSYSSHTHTMPQSRDHDVIPEEQPEEQFADRSSNSLDFDGSSIPRSTTTTGSPPFQFEDSTPPRRWQQEFQNSYSDNEKQLIEQMKRMKKEHSHILRTYEDRINKLMAKMHELRSIAEMLENSSSKSSPYGTCLVPAKGGILGILGSRLDQDRKAVVPSSGQDQEQPPPLPPRPGRGARLYPNKPIVQTQAKMTALPWNRVILKDDGKEDQTTIWHTMMEPKLDIEEIERLFRTPEVSPTDGATLYDDLIIRRGRSRYQLVSIYETDRSKRIVECMRCLRATLTEVIATVSSLDTSQINQDSLGELLDLMASVADIEKILHHVKKKGAGQLDHPEYFVFELSKVDHFRDRLEFMRFRYKLQWHLFEIDQQLRELHTACDEIMNSISLKNLLETLLSVGNYLNGGSELGQADGYHLDVLNRLKDIRDRDGRGTLLEFVLKTYCQVYENEVDIGCPTRFRLPEPSNMRHAAQVSFDGIQDALSNLLADLHHVREKLLDPKVNKNTTRPMDSFRVIAENFFSAAMEVIGDQEKVLQDTRDVFDKTVAHFAIETSVTPQSFFQIWAVFLHDCKYFWKLAHRRLAKERFELEFKYKGQASSCSLLGYGSFQAEVMKGLSCGQDIKTSTQLRKVDNWMKINNLPDVPQNSQHIEITDVTDHIADQITRPPSPKPITCTPPLSENVYKPQPKAPIISHSSQPLANGSVPVSPNYENQSSYERHIPKKDTSTDLGMRYLPETTKASVTSSENSKRFEQFSLKAWLKREKEQVKRDIENDTDVSNSESKQSPSRSLTKLKNSVFQKFGGGSSSKKHIDTPKKSKHYNKDAPTPPVKPVRQNIVHDISAPYAVVKKEIVSENNVLLARDYTQDKVFKEKETYNEDSVKEQIISPIEENEFECDNGIDLQNELVTRNEHAFEIRKGDENNNEKMQPKVSPHERAMPASTFLSPQTCSRFPSLFKENDVPRTHVGNTQISTYTPIQREEAFINTDSERLLAQKIPVYQAKILNNYEIQGKVEVAHAVRQHAEPLRAPTDTSYNFAGRNHDHSTFENYNKQFENQPLPEEQTSFHTPNNSPFIPSQKYAKTDPGPVLPSHRVQSSYRGSSRQNIERKRELGKHVPARYERDAPYSPSRFTASGNSQFTTANKNDQVTTQPSTGTVLDKFDRQNNNMENNPFIAFRGTEEGSVQKSAISPKPLTMTSTPVAHRRELSGNLDEINVTSPPLPPRSDKKKPIQTLKDNSLTSPSQNNRHLNPEIQSPANQSSYYESFTQNIQSPIQNSYKLGVSEMTSQREPNTFPNNLYSPQSYYNSPGGSDVFSQTNYHVPLSAKPYETKDFVNNNERDDSYSFQLRRAANNSAFDRYGQSPSQHQGRNGPYHQSPSGHDVVRTVTHGKEAVSYMAI